ncbi:hypothetical protein [Nitrososphaera sp.]
MGLKEHYEKFAREGGAGRSNVNELLKAIVDEVEKLKAGRTK